MSSSAASRAQTHAHLGTSLRNYFEAVWDEVLVPAGGASKQYDDRMSFILAHVVNPYPCTQYRFQGLLGFGGKLITQDDLRCRVNYYREDKTDLREEKQALINSKLEDLWLQYFSASPAPAPA